MKILFMQTLIGGDMPPSYHEGIASISSVLKNNKHEVNLFCLYSWNNLPLLEKRVNLFKPDIIAFSSTASAFRAVIKTSKFLKKKFPQIKIVCGGVHVTLCPEDFYKVLTLDIICLGEGEYAFLELVKKLEKGENYNSIDGLWVRDRKKIIKNPQRPIINNLDELPSPDREMFLKEGALWYTSGFFEKKEEKGLEFIFSRGCPFECTYCSNHALKKFYGTNYVRFKSPQRSINEIKSVVEKYRFDYFHFHDDTFTLNKNWLDSFLKGYKEIGVPFSCNIRVGTCTKEIFRKLKEAGCRGVLIGLESGDEKLRNEVLKKTMSNNQIKDSFKWAKEAGLKVFASVMIGFPEETPKKFLETIKLVSEINPDKYRLWVFYPYPGTELFGLCKKRRYFRKKIEKDLIERHDTVLELPRFPRKDILYYYKYFSILVALKEKRKNLVKKIHSKILFFLLSKPPSSKLFPIYRILFKIDRIISLSFKTISASWEKKLI